MIVTCPGCTSSYRVRNEAVPAEGARMRCPKCNTLFLAKPPAPGEINARADDDFAGPSLSPMGMPVPAATASGRAPVPAVGAASNPFLAAAAPANPFTTPAAAPAPSHPFAPQAPQNPFGSGPVASPLGAPAASPFPASPFAPGPSPFGGAASGAAPNPFLAPGASSPQNPFAPASNPFSAPKPGPPSNPFMAAAPGGPDPFAPRVQPPPVSGILPQPEGPRDPFLAQPPPANPSSGGVEKELGAALEDLFGGQGQKAPGPPTPSTPPPVPSKGVSDDADIFGDDPFGGPARPAFAPALAPAAAPAPERPRGLDVQDRAKAPPPQEPLPPRPGPERRPQPTGARPYLPPPSLPATIGSWALLVFAALLTVSGLGFAGWASGAIDLDAALMGTLEETLDVRPPRSYAGRDRPADEELENEAKVQEAMGDFAAAAVAWRRALERRPDDAALKAQLREMLLRLGDRPLAAQLAR